MLHTVATDEAFVGLIDHLPANARRDSGEIAASKQSVDSWLFEQLTLLKMKAFRHWSHFTPVILSVNLTTIRGTFCKQFW